MSKGLLERQVERDIKVHLERLGWLVTKIDAGQAARARKGRTEGKQGYSSLPDGFPDLLVQRGPLAFLHLPHIVPHDKKLCYNKTNSSSGTVIPSSRAALRRLQMKNKPLTLERLRELLHYDPLTGYFTWLVRSGDLRGARPGKRAGSKQKGYIYITVDDKLFLAHRLAWVYCNGQFPSDVIDHINCNGLDNRIENLRACTQGQNNQNQTKAHSSSRVGFLGVSPSGRRYYSRIALNGKVYHLGSFGTPEEAHTAYVEAKRRLHEFGTL